MIKQLYRVFNTIDHILSVLEYRKEISCIVMAVFCFFVEMNSTPKDFIITESGYSFYIGDLNKTLYNY